LAQQQEFVDKRLIDEPSKEFVKFKNTEVLQEISRSFSSSLGHFSGILQSLCDINVGDDTDEDQANDKEREGICSRLESILRNIHLKTESLHEIAAKLPDRRTKEVNLVPQGIMVDNAWRCASMLEDFHTNWTSEGFEIVEDYR